MPVDWDALRAELGNGYESAVLSATDDHGRPASTRVDVAVDDQWLRCTARFPVPLRDGPASLLLHRHDEKMWNLRSMLVRGDLRGDGADAETFRFTPTAVVPGMGHGGVRGLIAMLLRARRTAAAEIAARGQERPKVTWDALRRAKREARSR